ncbi:GNAT family N-acetyltransferase [Streptomyces sp. NPDC049602]|uniref:GNAT family N-acetyltransferase n=1 Tax=Streptomyces sp. NPDC049602 TaxID=3155504 RepID=UPI003440A89E
MRQVADESTVLLRGQVTLGLVPGAAAAAHEFDLPAIPAGFHEEHPQAEIALTEDASERMLTAMNRGDLDLAVIGLADEEPPPGVSVQVLVDDSPVAAVARTTTPSPPPDRTSIPLAELRDRPLISLPRGTGISSLAPSRAAGGPVGSQVAQSARTELACVRGELRTTVGAMTTRSTSADRPTSVPLTEAPLRQARNSAALWIATGRSRGHEVIRRRGFVAVDGGERAGLRILIQESDLDPGELAELSELARRAAGPVNAEDPFSSTDLGHLGMRSWQMPVMLRLPGPVGEPALDVFRVRRPEDLQAAEQIVIEGFELDGFTPYRPGELFPAALIEQPGVEVYVASHDGVPAGACVSVVDDGIGSHYWVGTSSAFRSRGVGRAVMLGSLAHLADLPLTLTASKLGRPLYESLGYTVAAPSTWWGPPLP